MADIFSKDTLENLGICFVDEDVEIRFREFIMDELEVRIGARIGKDLPEYVLEIFDNLEEQEEYDEWFRRYCPNRKEIIEEERDKLFSELKKFSGEIEGTIRRMEAEK